jgi:Domain of unknown function (DUF6702)
VRGALALAIFAWTASAHEYHASLAEVELNADTGHLEIALRVIPEDLEAALTAKHGAAVRLEVTDGVDAMIVDYLASRFRVVGASGEPQPITWVGKEVSYQAAWLYFEIPVAADGLWTLENRVLFDVSASQINTVLYRAGDSRSTWTFTVESQPVELPTRGS